MNKRQLEVQQQFLDNEKEALKKLEEMYKDALAEINTKIELLLARQDADMQHVIYRVEYQKSLKTQVQAILEQLQNKEFETLSEFLTGAYQDGFVGAMYDMQGQGVPLVFPIDQEQMVAAIQHETKLSEGLYAALGKDTKVLSKKIASEISRGIATGAMYGEIARNIASQANIPKNRAMTIARTEAHRIQCAATANAQWKAKEKGADVVKQWDSFLDGKTRHTHRELDGQIRELDEPFMVAGKKAMFPGDFGDPAEDCNCRCALLQRAKWALGDDIQKWVDGKLVTIKAKDYQSFKKEYFKKVDEAKSVRSKSQKMKDDFVPAKTIEEAEEKAKEFIGDGYSKKFNNVADFKGISLDNANEINKALEELYSQYDIPKLNGIKSISPTSAQGKKVFTSTDAVAAYDPIEKGIYLNKDVLKNADAIAKYNKEASEAWDIVMKNIDNLSGSQKELALIYKNAGRSLVGNGSVKDYITHEMGHHVQWNVLDAQTNNAMGKNMSKFAQNISGYANASKGEYIAESFAAYMKGEIGKLDPDFVTFMTSKQKPLENIGKSSTIDVSLQFFAEKDIVNQGSNSLKRAIRKYETKISEHEAKIKNPEEYISDWNEKDVREQQGLIKHWQKEINNFNQSISDRVDELKARGDYND